MTLSAILNPPAVFQMIPMPGRFIAGGRPANLQYF
jgi:hypothetical protein